MDMRDRTEVSFEEAMLHLSQLFNSRVSQMLHKAIYKEIENAKQDASSSHELP